MSPFSGWGYYTGIRRNCFFTVNTYTKSPKKRHGFRIQRFAGSHGLGVAAESSELCQMARSGKTTPRRRSVNTIGTITNSARPVETYCGLAPCKACTISDAVLAGVVLFAFRSA